MSAAATLITTNGWPIGLVGMLGYRVLDNAGSTKIARATAGVVADAGGNYHATPPLDRAWGAWLVIWDNGAGQYAAQATNVSASSPLFVASGFPTGLVGTLSYSVKDGDGNVLLAPITAGIVEIGYGAYWVKPDSALLAGIRTIVWANGSTTTSETIDFEGGGATGYFTDLTEADELGDTVAGLASYRAATSAVRAQALQSAADAIDAQPFQGRRYDLTSAQTREFPRVARGSVNIWPQLGTYNAAYMSGSEIWEWDSTNNVAIVPSKVKLANLYEADSIINGDRDRAIAAASRGITSESIGSASRSYVDWLKAAAIAEKLSPKADRYLRKYRLVSGELL